MTLIMTLKGLLSTSRPGKWIAVGFRGTESGTNCLRDFVIAQIPRNPKNLREGLVHRGFALAFYPIVGNIAKAVARAVRC